MTSRALAGVLLLAGAAQFCVPSLAAQSRRPLPEGYRLVFSSDVTAGRYLFSDPGAWLQGDDDILELVGQSEYRPPHRSPLNIALVAPWLFERFVFEVEIQQTGREYGHRDACLFFGFENAERFYYAHLATTPDDRAHNVFLVNGSPRTKTTPVNEQGVDWGQYTWHRVRIERGVRSATAVEVYFGDAEAPTLSSHDATIGWGRLGVGSFDDTARFRRLRVWAPEVREAGADPFR